MRLVENKLDTADVIERWRSMEAILQRAVSKTDVGLSPTHKPASGIGELITTNSAIQVANGRQLPSSFGRKVRDRATRLRSSDAPWIGDCRLMIVD